MPKKAKWDEIPCPECKEPVAFNATRCPHCQAVYPQSMVEGRKASHESTQKWSLGCVVIVIILLLSMCAFGGSENETVADNPIGNESSVAVPAAGSANESVTAAVMTFHDDIMAAVNPCDVAAKSLAERADGLTTGATSIYDAYSLAARVEDACRESWRVVGDVQIPEALQGAARESAEGTVEACENAMIAKQMGGEAMKEVFDGDMRPSKVDEARRMSEAAQAGVLACVAGIFDTGIKAGVDVGKIGE